MIYNFFIELKKKKKCFMYFYFISGKHPHHSLNSEGDQFKSTKEKKEEKKNRFEALYKDLSAQKSL